MALFSLPFLLTALVTTVFGYLAISAMAVLAHWISVLGAVGVGIGIAYLIIDGELYKKIGIEGDFLGSTSTVAFSVAMAGVSYRMFEAVFAVLGFGLAFIIVIVAVAGSFFGPVLVAQVLGGFIGGLFGGE